MAEDEVSGYTWTWLVALVAGWHQTLGGEQWIASGENKVMEPPSNVRGIDRIPFLQAQSCSNDRGARLHDGYGQTAVALRRACRRSTRYNPAGFAI
jgi:hypothetical protein